MLAKLAHYLLNLQPQASVFIISQVGITVSSEGLWYGLKDHTWEVLSPRL
jgi:hypothetical protein